MKIENVKLTIAVKRFRQPTIFQTASKRIKIFPLFQFLPVSIYNIVVAKAKNEYPAPVVVSAVKTFAGAVSKLFFGLEFHGTKNIPQNLRGGLVIAPNHQTYIDPVWIVLPIKRDLRFMAWDEAFDWFLIGKIIRYLGAFPVNTEANAFASYKKALRVLRDGATLTIFPEGARALPDGNLLEFKNGAVKIAMEAGVPILPVTVRGGNRIWAREMKYPQSGKVEIVYHPLMPIPQIECRPEKAEQIEMLTEKLKATIASAL